MKTRPERYGFGRVKQRGKAWWIYWYADGEKRESVARVLGKPVSAVTARDAHRLLAERLQAKARNELVAPKYERATVAEMLAEYEQHKAITHPATIRKYRTSIRSTAAWLGTERLDKLNDLPYLESLAAARERQGYARSTVKQRLAVLHAALVFWKTARRIASVPEMPKLKLTNERKGFFLDEEMRRFIATMPEVAADITWALYYLGWRLNEVLGFTWDRVNLADRVLHLDKDQEKHGDGRMRPMTEPGLLAVFERRWQARTLAAPWVFWRPLRRGTQQGACVSEAWYRAQWQAARIASGLTKKIPHDFRRTAYYEDSLAGVDIATTMDRVGHKSLATAKRYQVFDMTRQRAGLERLEAHRRTRGVQPLARLTAEERATWDQLNAKMTGGTVSPITAAGSAAEDTA